MATGAEAVAPMATTMIDLTAQKAIPEAGMQAAPPLLQNGKTSSARPRWATPGCCCCRTCVATSPTWRACASTALAERCARWNQRYHWLAGGLARLPGVCLPQRPPQEHYVQSSIQFLVRGRSGAQMQRFVAAAAAGGVNVKWFGADEPLGFTSNWTSLRYADLRQDLPTSRACLPACAACAFH
jgi:hypothetical protein